MQPSITSASYDDLCIMWQRALPEMTLRSLAADYVRGHIDASTIDAFKEYERRFGPHEKGTSPTSRKSKKARAGRYK